jgi:hypothetical protein
MNEKLTELKNTYKQNELIILSLYRKRDELSAQLEKVETEIKESNNHQAGLAREIQDVDGLLSHTQ